MSWQSFIFEPDNTIYIRANYIEIGLFKTKSPRALEIGMVQTSVISLALEIEIVRNAVKLEKLYSN